MRCAVAVFVFTFAHQAGAQKPWTKPKPAPLRSPQAMAKVIAAFRASDEEALEALASRDQPDPWLVADELCNRGEHDAAAAFAVAAPRKDVEKLPAYVASRRGKKPDEGVRRAVAVASKALIAEDGKTGEAALVGLDTSEESVLSVQILFSRGSALFFQRRFEEAMRAFANAAERAGRLGWLVAETTALSRSGRCAYSIDDWDRALAAWQRLLAVHESRRDRGRIAGALNNIAIIHHRRGDYPKALEFCDRSRELMIESRDRVGLAKTLVNIGTNHKLLGDYRRALEFYGRSLEILDAAGYRGELSLCLNNIGNAHERLGDYTKALEFYGRSLRLAEKHGNRTGIAASLNSIGNVHGQLGDYPRALELVGRALEIAERRGDRATLLNNIGNMHGRLGNFREALQYYQRSLRIDQALRNRAGISITLNNIGDILVRIGEHDKALQAHQRSLGIDEELGNRAGIAMSLYNIGGVHQARGEHARALELYERSLGVSNELSAPDLQVLAWTGKASTCRSTGDPEASMDAARRAIDGIGQLVGGASARGGATARARYRRVFEIGALAARDRGDPAGFSFFLESGRAGTLLEALQGREKLEDAVLPAELLAAERRARSAETVALRVHHRALATGRLAESKETRAALESARKERAEVIARIQRTAKAAASVVYPKADPLSGILANLRPGEALVVYALFDEEAIALLATADDARLVPLGEPGEIVTACEELQRASVSNTGGWAKAAARLRTLVSVPLRLGPDVQRLLISPDGALSYVPFALLVPDREVVMVPSGTTYGVLLDERAKRGQGVLALGDPEYGTKAQSGTQLSPLPGTRPEAKAVGDTVLLGHDASEAGLLRAVAARSRWRAVHFACHGLIRADLPQLSSLALTPDDENDGLLSMLEVFRMKIPADLVVLSACETAKGKMYKAEGVVAFTRAFMMSGVPRVVVSLWEVDDEATRALMVKFYELLKTHPTATALKKAQAFVASHEDWKHPYYWGAWQLWGLPD